MSQPKAKKKVVTTTRKTDLPEVKTRRSSTTKEPRELIFNKDNYMWMGLGAGLILLGMLLMMGGKMPTPDVWDDSIIYSFRRTVIAPIFILAGLGVEIYAIFKRA